MSMDKMSTDEMPTFVRVGQNVDNEFYLLVIYLLWSQLLTQALSHFGSPFMPLFLYFFFPGHTQFSFINFHWFPFVWVFLCGPPKCVHYLALPFYKYSNLHWKSVSWSEKKEAITSIQGVTIVYSFLHGQNTQIPQAFFIFLYSRILNQFIN